MSNFLLDTHAFIWLSENDSNLPNNLREIIDVADQVCLSIASLWEIAIKLIAQAMNRSLIVVSRDTKLDAYPIQRLWE